ncbi:hypothetical protein KI387_000834, partial [Taxus chinensis]
MAVPPGISGSERSQLSAPHMADSQPRYHQGHPDNTGPLLSPPYNGPMPPWLLGLVPRLLIAVAPTLLVHLVPVIAPVPTPVPVAVQVPVPVPMAALVPVAVLVP